MNQFIKRHKAEYVCGCGRIRTYILKKSNVMWMVPHIVLTRLRLYGLYN